MKISKLDVAKRELEYSIRLFFLSGDPVVIHLVVSAAQTILRDLAQAKKIPTILDKLLESVKPDKRDFVKTKLAAAHNFMKHADRDADKVLEFYPEASEYALWECIDLYYQLTTEVTGLMQAYRIFFYTKNADILFKPEDNVMFNELRKDIDLNNKSLLLKLAEELENKRNK